METNKQTNKKSLFGNVAILNDANYPQVLRQDLEALTSRIWFIATKFYLCQVMM